VTTIVKTEEKKNRSGFLPMDTNLFDRCFISVVGFIAIHLLWMRFLEGCVSLTVATLLSLALAVVIVRDKSLLPNQTELGVRILVSVGLAIALNLLRIFFFAPCISPLAVNLFAIALAIAIIPTGMVDQARIYASEALFVLMSVLHPPPEWWIWIWAAVSVGLVVWIMQRE
jgi:predicted small integral membrane protein